MRTILSLFITAICTLASSAAEQFITFQPAKGDDFAIVDNSRPVAIYVDPAADDAVKIAAKSLAADFGRVSGTDATLMDTPKSNCIIVGTIGSPVIDRMIKAKHIDVKQLKGKNEKYLLQVIDNPRQDVALLAALRSPLFGFTPDRLALLRAAGKGTVYDCLAAGAARGEADCADFLALLGEL
ncbi:MAG: hypothetical protein K2L31_00395, partial [Muribaculum sp.]|nr:hypothetical protein [Muribaculum sp.]